jgi:hypothetical protein
VASPAQIVPSAYLPTSTPVDCDVSHQTHSRTLGILSIVIFAKESMMSFEKHFTQSIQFRSHFDAQFKLNGEAIQLLEKTFRQTSNKAMLEPFFSIRQGLCSLAQQYAFNNSVAAYSYQCLADSHVFLQACVDQNMIGEKYMNLTVGDVSFKGEKLFNATRGTIESAVSNGISTTDKPLFHVWLTLGDLTVIDLTIVNYLDTRGLLDKPAPTDQLLNVWRPERQGDYEYHPVLVDDDFIMRLQKPVH